MGTIIEPKYYSIVENRTKDGFKKAITECCENLNDRLDDILCDFDKSLKEINIQLKVSCDYVSVISITKEVAVEVEKE